MLEKLRFVVIGIGATIYGQHRLGFDLDCVEVVGVHDINTARGQERAKEIGTTFYDDYHTMLTETKPDVAVVITPHPFHMQQSIDCLQAGCHVLVEKPIAVQIADADRMIKAAEDAGKVLAVNFQQRFRPEIVAAQNLIKTGQLGDLQYVNIQRSWTRTALYYDMVDWRGTWKGEGGGVLMNQSPHELDLICLLMGMPRRVFAWARTQLHNIQTEDTIQAMLEWDNGALGSVHISTAEAGLEQKFEIVGTKGHLQIEEGNLTFNEFDVELKQFISESKEAFAAPNLNRKPINLISQHGDHVAVYDNLCDAILHGAPLLVDAPTASRGLELANAMNYSSHQSTPVEFPLNREAYSALLEKLRAEAG